MESNYGRSDLEMMAREAWNGPIQQHYDPMGDETMDQFTMRIESWQRCVKRLYKDYGDDIWGICLHACHPGVDKTVFEGLARLSSSDQVQNPAGFEEFMVRNALTVAASQILGGRQEIQP